MKCLVIDDDRKFCSVMQTRLELMGYTTDVRLTPSEGIKMADDSKNYDLIFIDLAFGNELSRNGADIGALLRKKHPLSALVLLTAHGKESIKDFIYVGFDNYLDKYDEGKGANLSKMFEEFEMTIEVALTNSQKRCKSIFSQEELTDMFTFLEAIEETINFMEGEGLARKINSHTIAGGVGLLVKNSSPLDKKILSSLSEKESIRKKEIKKYDLFSFNYLSSTIFELIDKRTGYCENALKVRQLLKSEPNRWKKTRGLRENNKPYYNPVYVISKEFSV